MRPNLFSKKLKLFIFKSTKCIHSCLNCGCFSSRISHVTWICVKDEKPEYIPPIIETIQETSILIKCSNERVFSCKIFAHCGKIKHAYKYDSLSYLRLIVCIGNVKVEATVNSNFSFKKSLFKNLFLTAD